MNKEQKTAAVEQLTADLKEAGAIFAIDYRGISVPQAAELRSGLREADASFRVVKNRLTLRAADAAGTEAIKDFLVGPTALTLVDGDVALAAKTISKLGGEWELLEYKGGIMDGAPLDADSFQAIAKLPGRDQLNAQFAGVVASPLTGLVRGLGSMISGLASQLQQIADQGLVSGEPPKEAPAEEAEAESPEASGESEPEQSEPDPDPAESPEEAPSEEEAPEGETAGEGAEADETGEGDQDLGEREQTSEQTSDEPSDETKEDGD
jgi:large subunit ribosomal protein L10